MVAFVDGLGPKTDPRTVQLERLVDLTYLDDARMPYHGRSHVTEVRENARHLVERCYEKGIAVDVPSLERAIMLHDALMHLDPKHLGFRSAEELASRFAYNFMTHAGYSPFEAQRVERIILATNPSVRPLTVEEIIMRAADLWNVGCSYETFCKGTFKLHREAELKRNESLPPDSWITQSFSYLRLFLWPMLELTPAARDEAGRSKWHIQALSNMTRLWRETAATRGKVVAEVIDPQVGPTIPQEEKPFFFIALHEDEGYREKLMQELTKPIAKNSVACVIPGGASALSLPDGCCDELILGDLSLPAMREAFRVVRHGGHLLFPLPKEGNHPPESGPIPPGFIYHSRETRGDRSYVVLEKDSPPPSEAISIKLPPSNDSLRGWAKALDNCTSLELPDALTQELRATMAERYTRLARNGMLTIPVESVGVDVFLKNPQEYLARVAADSLYVFIEPKDRDSLLPRWRGKATSLDLPHRISTVIGDARPEHFMLTTQPHHHILYNANVVVRESGEMVAEFSRGDDLPSRMGAELLFSARRDPITGLFSYSTQSAQQRKVAYDILQAIPGEGEGRERQYRPGYYEVAVAKDPTGEGILPLFFDYRTHPFFTGEGHGTSAPGTSSNSGD